MSENLLDVAKEALAFIREYRERVMKNQITATKYGDLMSGDLELCRGLSLAIKAEEHQGWSNRETWAVNLHISNDRGLYELAKEAVARGVAEAKALSESMGLEPPARPFRSGNYLQDIFADLESFTPEANAILREIGSLWRVNWEEIAQHFVAEEVEA